MLTRAALHVPADWVVAGRAGASTVLLLLTVLMGSTQAVPGVMELKAIVLLTPLVGEEVVVRDIQFHSKMELGQAETVVLP